MQVTRGVVWLARSGYAARGLVYSIVAFFAALAALGAARTVDTKGAIEELLTQPFGAVLVSKIDMRRAMLPKNRVTALKAICG